MHSRDNVFRSGLRWLRTEIADTNIDRFCLIEFEYEQHDVSGIDKHAIRI
jgi:hypothetical protein